MAQIIELDTASQQIADAIAAITSQAEEDSLLRDPFDSALDVEAFVSPLTEDEQNLLDTWLAERERLQEEYDDLQEFLILEGSMGYFEHPPLVDLQNRIDQLTAQINIIQVKVDIAYAAYLEELKARKNDYTEDQKATIQEFSELVDKFETFKSEGLYGLGKKDDPDFERNFKNFIEGQPEILFIAEYVVEGELAGALLCLERYERATHYEVLKRNSFKSKSKFERILVLGNSDFNEETQNYLPYVKDTLGFSDLSDNKILLMLDTEVKRDRIYEYKVRAGYVPNSAIKLDFDLILESKGNLVERSLSPADNFTLFEKAGSVLRNKTLAWIFAAVNENVPFFGLTSAEQPMSQIISNPVFKESGAIQLFIPKSPARLMDVIREAMNLVGMRQTFEQLLRILGGVPPEFVGTINEPPVGYDTARNVFSYDAFRRDIVDRVPEFQLVFEIAETEDPVALNELSKLSIELPMNTGSETLTTLDGLTRTLNFLNDTYIALTYAQASGNFEKLTQIRALIALNRDEEVPIEIASEENRSDVAVSTNSEPAVETLNNTSAGALSDSDQDVQDNEFQTNPIAILLGNNNG